ncbi:OLC1v1026619C2 [Oldenlandia corymbosa var. corymbosa]|uniref:OLC1v1026619C2 n=1 Tax=Oldenlandia corymbosa var. corymbosa TaxID=529605 RepID=A0AAV1C7F8_OLDCO|nr:OLC1v1026619C2 [Oldenlandia corymbosa var. corymbosa]
MEMMTSNSQLLEVTLADILRVVHPLKEDWTARFFIIQELQKVVQSIESLRGATVEPFGSFVSNLFTRWGDLDISIEVPNGSYISCPAKKHKLALLTDLIKALRKRGGWRNLHFIQNARIPILKFETHQNISCDVSINNLSGQMKSKMLFWLNEIDGRFRDVVLLVKEWAKAHGVNEPKSGTLNSYSLSLLVVFHFQTCEPALFPPLKDIYPGNMVDDLVGVRTLAEKKIQDAFAVGINGYKSDKTRGINRSSLSELFISFLHKFCDLSSRAQTQGINIFTGSWEDISTNMRWLPRTYTLCVISLSLSLSLSLHKNTHAHSHICSKTFGKKTL